jgi:hypothetical protein
MEKVGNCERFLLQDLFEILTRSRGSGIYHLPAVITTMYNMNFINFIAIQYKTHNTNCYENKFAINKSV